jgi:signal transduction histidine kinase
VLSHRSRLDQAVDIAVDNALRHGQGTVTVAVASDGGHLHISVSDEGPGIVRAVHESDPDRHERGKRIGLDLARRLVESDGGRLRIAQFDQPVITMILPTAAEATLPTTSSTDPLGAS